MVKKAKARLCDIQFNEINDRVHNFISTMKEELDDIDAELQAEFEKCRVTKRKSMPVQEVQDEIADDVVQRFHIEVFRRVIDQITTGITERFSTNSELIRDIACFDPNRFEELSKSGVPFNDLEKVASLVGVSAVSLKAELASFISVFKHLSKTLHDGFDDIQAMESILEEAEEGRICDIEPTAEEMEKGILENRVACKGTCKQCLVCCYRMLYRYSLNTTAFSNLFLAYDYLLTLSFTQVSCERAFSKLKQVKTRLRSTLGNDKLEAFILMDCERDLLEYVSPDYVIRHLSEKSTVFKNMFSA